MKESNLKMTNCPDEDISGDHLLAEARVSLVKIFPQMQKQFQVGFRLDLTSTKSDLDHNNGKWLILFSSGVSSPANSQGKMSKHLIALFWKIIEICMNIEQ